MTKKNILILLFILGFSFHILAQSNPVKWDFSIENNGNGEIDLIVNATIKQHWHLYDTVIPDGGPYPTSLSIDKLEGATPIGDFQAKDSKLIKKYDPIFNMKIGYFDNKVKFIQRFKITDKKRFKLSGYIRAQACDGNQCTPPLPIKFTFNASNLPSTIKDLKKNYKINE